MIQDDAIVAGVGAEEQPVVHEKVMEQVKVPPPAYGLWRSSVVSGPAL
jgi:hypothetical protein